MTIDLQDVLRFCRLRNEKNPINRSVKRTRIDEVLRNKKRLSKSDVSHL